MWEIHCPNCGEVKHSEKKTPKVCPRCNSDKIIALWWDHDTALRFSEERTEQLKRLRGLD